VSGRATTLRYPYRPVGPEGSEPKQPGNDGLPNRVARLLLCSRRGAPSEKGTANPSTPRRFWLTLPTRVL
jgi:hypothetical protein